MACTCKVGPGKFEGESARAFMAWQQLMHGNSDIDCGNIAFFKSPLNFDADASVVRAAKEYGYCDACIEAAAEHDVSGVSVYEDGNGFVYCVEYATQAEYDAAVEAAETECANDDE